MCISPLKVDLGPKGGVLSFWCRNPKLFCSPNRLKKPVYGKFLIIPKTLCFSISKDFLRVSIKTQFKIEFLRFNRGHLVVDKPPTVSQNILYSSKNPSSYNLSMKKIKIMDRASGISPPDWPKLAVDWKNNNDIIICWYEVFLTPSYFSSQV